MTKVGITDNSRVYTTNVNVYLEDDEIEFVKYEMSGVHHITDICNFYANLDIGYGKILT